VARGQDARAGEAVIAPYGPARTCLLTDE